MADIGVDADIDAIRVREAAAPGTPAAGYGKIYEKTDGKLYFKNDAGTETELTQSSGGYTEGARAYNSANISTPNNTDTVLSFDSERYDTDTIHDNVTNNSRLTATTAGKYLIVANFRFAANATGHRRAFIRLNGATPIALMRIETETSGPQYTAMILTTIYDLSATDYVEVVVKQNSGGALNIEAASNYSPEFMMQRIG